MSNKLNLFDQATDILKERMNDGMNVIREEYRSTNPYRKVRKSSREQLYEYAEFTRDKEMMMRQALGDDAVNLYITNMEKLKKRYEGVR